VVAVCERAVADHGYVSTIDIVIGLGWLHPVHVESWRRGTGVPLGPYAVPVERILQALVHVGEWAGSQGMTSVATRYVGTDRAHTPLQFTGDGDPEIEAILGTHWVRPDAVPAETPSEVAEGRRRKDDLVVIAATRAWSCAECGDEGDLLRMDGGVPICLACADLDHLVYLPRGDTALTRRSRAGSTLSAIVVRWSRSRHRYERQGVLVEVEALERAEEQCLADADLRERRRLRAGQRRLVEDVRYTDQLAQEVRRLFPGCPPERAAAIAVRAGERGSGRVGRTAAAKSFDPHMIELAVIAAIRHEDTPYDDLLMAGVDRASARQQIRDSVDAVLDRWRSPS
jgi:hypothetical protein